MTELRTPSDFVLVHSSVKLTVIQFGNPIHPDGLGNKLVEVKLTDQAANNPADHGQHLSGKQPEKLFTHYSSCQWKED